MIKKDRYILILFAIVSMLMFLALSNRLTIVFFANGIHYPFYLLAILVPLWMCIRWIKRKSKTYFILFMMSIVPGLVFGIWFLIVIVRLGELLSNF